MPDDGGAAISDIEYRLDDGSWASSGGTTSFTISGLTNDQEYAVELRAVNAVGAGAASDTKSMTPAEQDGEQAIGLVVHQGDSISQGLNDYVEPSLPLWEPHLNLINQAIGGTRMSNWLPDLPGHIALFDDVPDTEPKIFAIMEGNSISDGNWNGKTPIENLADYCNAIRRSSNNIRVLAVTTIPRDSGGGFESGRQTVNQFWRDSVGTIIDAVCDLDDLMPPELITYPVSVEDDTLYPDGIHPSLLVYEPIRPIYAAAINAMSASILNDVTAPTIARLTPLNGANTLLGNEFPFILRFGEHVKFTGDVLIELYDGDDDLIESWDQSDIGSGIAIHGIDLEITPSSQLADDTSYYINISPDSITDIAGNAFAGVDDDSTWAFTVPLVVDLTPNLVAFWELEEASGTRTDSIGSNDLTDNNTVTQETGKVGNCARFTSANSEYLSIADNDDLGYSGDFSIATWFRDGIGNATLACKGTTGFQGAEWEILLEFISGGFKLAARLTNSGGGQTVASSAAALSNGNWYLGIVTYKAATRAITVSVNAGTRGTVTLSSFNPARKSQPLRLGANLGVSTFYNGRLDQFGFWKRALTPAEEAWLYNSGNGRTYAEIAATGA